jgi:hypothetical protein
MNMCEYANNILDMGLLVYLAEKNRRIVYDNEDYASFLLYVYQYKEMPRMAIPKMNGELNFIRFSDWHKSMAIVNVSNVNLEFYILYG